MGGSPRSCSRHGRARSSPFRLSLLWRTRLPRTGVPSSGAYDGAVGKSIRSAWQRLARLWSGPQVPSVPPVTVLLPQPLRSQAVRLRELGEEVEAVRLVREQTALGLLPALFAVRSARDVLTEPDG